MSSTPESGSSPSNPQLDAGSSEPSTKERLAEQIKRLDEQIFRRRMASWFFLSFFCVLIAWVAGLGWRVVISLVVVAVIWVLVEASASPDNKGKNGA